MLFRSDAVVGGQFQNLHFIGDDRFNDHITAAHAAETGGIQDLADPVPGCGCGNAFFFIRSFRPVAGRHIGDQIAGIGGKLDAVIVARGLEQLEGGHALTGQIVRQGINAGELKTSRPVFVHGYDLVLLEDHVPDHRTLGNVVDSHVFLAGNGQGLARERLSVSRTARHIKVLPVE